MILCFVWDYVRYRKRKYLVCWTEFRLWLPPISILDAESRSILKLRETKLYGVVMKSMMTHNRICGSINKIPQILLDNKLTKLVTHLKGGENESSILKPSSCRCSVAGLGRDWVVKEMEWPHLNSQNWHKVSVAGTKWVLSAIQSWILTGYNLKNRYNMWSCFWDSTVITLTKLTNLTILVVIAHLSTKI